MKIDSLSSAALAYIDAHEDELKALTRALCRIPAPSWQEEKRAEACREYLVRHGFAGAFVDKALNAVCSFGDLSQGPVALFMAHTDTVFPDTEPFSPRETPDGILYCPGAGDDTANVAVLLTAAAFFKEVGARPAGGVLIACNSGEEGLGNLKGCRALMEAWGERIGEVVSFDGSPEIVCARSVGSHRYRVTVRTRGGHSFADFGEQNAIVCLSSLVYALSKQPIPKDGEDSRTTWNVGMIKGGTSVNAIAQEASMLYEYRSDSAPCLKKMKEQFEEALGCLKAAGVEVKAERIGERPCMGGVDPKAQAELVRRCREGILAVTGKLPKEGLGSTDCNLPLSMGIPAAELGLVRCGGAHTREEWADLGSLREGFLIAVELMKRYFEEPDGKGAAVDADGCTD